MTITTEEAEWLAQQHDLVRFTLGMKAPEHDLTASTIRSLAAERDALRAERNAERNARFKSEAEFSHMQRRIARQRRALVKLYQRRQKNNALITALMDVIATARKDGMEQAAQRLIEKYQSIIIRPNTPEAWRFSILQDLQEMAGEKPNVITAADIDAAAIRAALGETQ